MARRLALVLALLLLLPLGPAQAALPDTANGQPLPTLAPMIEQVQPAVVNIATVGKVRVENNPLFSDPFFRRFFDLPDQPRERKTQSLGSGVIIDADQGLIVTNQHVIANAVKIMVTTSDGRQLPAEVVGTDPEADVAVIRVEGDNLTDLPLADSDELRVGDFVVALGNPFGLGQTVTSGMVSALGRTGLGIESYEDFIQTDASINPGNSGGALVNLRGELVGINTAILGPSGGNVGIGFAIPANMVKEITAQLVEYGEVRRGQLGVVAQDLTPQLAKAFNIDRSRGAVVTRVTQGLPAERAGIEAGDVIIAVDGEGVKNASDLRNQVGLLRVGEEIALTVLRDGKRLHIRTKIGEPEAVTLKGEKLHPRLAGAVIGEVDEATPRGRLQGVAIVEIQQGSPAWSTGLREGDLITSVNRKEITELEEFRQLARQADSLLLNIQRGNNALFLVLQ